MISEIPTLLASAGPVAVLGFVYAAHVAYLKHQHRQDAQCRQIVEELARLGCGQDAAGRALQRVAPSVVLDLLKLRAIKTLYGRAAARRVLVEEDPTPPNAIH